MSELTSYFKRLRGESTLKAGETLRVIGGVNAEDDLEIEVPPLKAIDLPRADDFIAILTIGGVAAFGSDHPQLQFYLAQHSSSKASKVILAAGGFNLEMRDPNHVKSSFARHSVNITFHVRLDRRFTNYVSGLWSSVRGSSGYIPKPSASPHPLPAGLPDSSATLTLIRTPVLMNQSWRSDAFLHQRAQPKRPRVSRTKAGRKASQASGR